MKNLFLMVFIMSLSQLSFAEGMGGGGSTGGLGNSSGGNQDNCKTKICTRGPLGTEKCVEFEGDCDPSDDNHNDDEEVVK